MVQKNIGRRGMRDIFKLIDFEEDYKDLTEWLTYWKFPVIPKDFLPDTTFILVRDGVKICSCCVYMAKTGKLAVCEWFVVNPKAPKPLRKDCLINLLTYIGNYLKFNSYKFIFTNTNNTNMINTLNKSEFKKTDINITNFLKVL